MALKESKVGTKPPPEESPEEPSADDVLDYVDDYFESDLDITEENDNDLERQRKIRRLLEDRLEQKRLREELDYLDMDDDSDVS